MSQNTQFPLVKNDNVPCSKFHRTPSVFAVFPAHDLLVYRLALFVAFLAWSAPAAAQSMTGYPLAGVHATQACARCHTTMPYKTAPTTCGSCHVADFQKTVNPPHVASGFPTTCDTCHKFTDATWKLASFNHSTATTFALAGVHTTQACTVCHVNNVYKGTPNTCVGCHLNNYPKNYNNSVNPPHLAGGFSTTCSTCHAFSAPAWSPASFNHSTATTFALAGVHTTQACTVCHVSNVYKGTPNTCVGCHLNKYPKNYNNSVNPPHLAGGFSTTCNTCHAFSAPAWSPSIFNHSTATAFALAGVHTTQACTVCHVSNVYKGTPNTCVGCHLNKYPKNYNNSVNPPHLAGGFPTTCSTCHQFSALAWAPSTFNHSSMTPFPLVGVHATQTCVRCHKTMPYSTAPMTCVGCHLTDYNTATTPVNHIAAGFPTTCETCHKATDATWLLGTFNHTYFPLTSNHNRPCADCHKTPGVYTVFTCTICHTKSTTDSKHQGRAGYTWTSQACYSCHPNGRAG